jgi:hypothetical protein
MALTIESISTIQRGTNLDDDIYCQVKFAEVSFLVDVYAHRLGDEEFQRTLWQRLEDGEFGEVTFPPTNYPRHPKTQTELAAEARAKRDNLLVTSDWTESTERLSLSVKANWATYRDSLRNISDQAGFPYEITWPVSP